MKMNSKLDSEINDLIDEYIVSSYPYAKYEDGITDMEIWRYFIKAFFGNFNESGFYDWVESKYDTSIDCVIGISGEDFFDLCITTNTPIYCVLRTYKQAWNWIAHGYVMSLTCDEIQKHIENIKNMDDDDRMGWLPEADDIKKMES